jgi:hypothetical protein
MNELDGTLIRVDDDGTATRRPLAELPALLAEPSGWLWLDLPEPETDAAELLVETFGLHRQAVQDVLARNRGCTSTATSCSSCCTGPRPDATATSTTSNSTSSSRSGS